MNRLTALLLGLATLLAHTLAIHDTRDGEFGPTLDRAHVVYRLARKLVFEGSYAWNPGDASYGKSDCPVKQHR